MGQPSGEGGWGEVEMGTLGWRGEGYVNRKFWWKSVQAPDATVTLCRYLLLLLLLLLFGRSYSASQSSFRLVLASENDDIL